MSSRAQRRARHWPLPRLPPSLSSWSRSVPHLPSLPPSQLCTYTRAPFISQAEDQTPTRSWLKWRVLTRAAFIRALAQAQTKQDVSSKAAGKMGPVWVEATGVKSVFSSLSSTVAGPHMASPSPGLHQPCARAQRESERHLCCVRLLTVQCSSRGWEAS